MALAKCGKSLHLGVIDAFPDCLDRQQRKWQMLQLDPVPTPTSLPDPGDTSIDPTRADTESLEKIKSGKSAWTNRANKPIKDEAGSGNAMEGPFAKLDGLNVNREIMDDEKV